MAPMARNEVAISTSGWRGGRPSSGFMRLRPFRRLQQCREAGHDHVARGTIVLADRRHVVPPLDGDARGQRTEIAAKGNDSSGASDIARGHAARTMPISVDAF